MRTMASAAVGSSVYSTEKPRFDVVAASFEEVDLRAAEVGDVGVEVEGGGRRAQNRSSAMYRTTASLITDTCRGPGSAFRLAPRNDSALNADDP